MTPAVPFSKVPDQFRLRSLKLEASMVPQPGRVMFCRGRKIIGYGDVGKLGDRGVIPDQADTVCISTADFDDVRSWRG